VTHVVITHAHRDHYWAALASDCATPTSRFPNAIHVLPSADWSLPRPGALLGLACGDRFDGLTEADFVARVQRFLGPVERDGRLRLVQGDVALTPSVTLVQSGGETDGHQVVRLRSDGAAFYYLGDLVHYPAELAEPDIGPTRLGPDQLAALQASRRRLFAEAADSSATCVATHFPFPGWGRITQRAPGSWSWEPG
jgi:glyoxylase-like metal-dependent hydrolase (beta-lactamase superfamily II)